MKHGLEDRELKWDGRHKDNILCGTGIMQMTAKVLARATVAKAAPAQKARNEECNETAMQEARGLVASQRAGTTQDGEPEKCQLQQQPILNPIYNSNSSMNSNIDPNLSQHRLWPEGGRHSDPEHRARRHPPAQAPPCRLD
jgi:hypothetical protein